MRFLSALIGCILVSMLAVVGPANSGIVTVDITGTGTGTLGGTDFTDVPFDLFLVGPDSNTNVVNLTTATVSIDGNVPNTFSDLMHIGIHFTPDFAFFGYQSGGANLLELTFSPSDFALLTSTNSFSGAPISSFFDVFIDVQTSGGLLSFTDMHDLNLSAISTGSQTPLPAALPLFAGGLGVMGWLARRRKRKNAAALSAA